MVRLLSASRFRLHNASWGDNLAYVIMALFFAFPIIDYLLRSILPIPVVSSLWDEMVMAAGLLLVLLKFAAKKCRPTLLVKLILGLVLMGLAYLTLDLTTAAINIEGFRAVFEYIFVFFIGFYLIQKPAQIRTLLSLAVGVGALLALHGIYQWIVKTPMPAGWVDTTEAVRTRVFSIVGSPNALGSQMAMMIPVSVGLLLGEKSWPRRVLWLGAAMLMTVCLVFTGSRGAWLALAGAVGIFGMLYDRRILIAGVAAAVLAIVFVPSVSHRILYLFSAEYMAKSAQSGRISRWFDAYDQMRNNPLFGAGLGHYGGAVAKRSYNVTYTDNYYLKTLAEMGLTGLLAFVGILVKTLQEGYRAFRKAGAPGHRFMAAGMLIGLLAVALHNGVENIFEIPYLNTYFWLTAGLLTALPMLRGEEEDLHA